VIIREDSWLKCFFLFSDVRHGRRSERQNNTMEAKDFNDPKRLHHENDAAIDLALCLIKIMIAVAKMHTKWHI